MVKRSNREQLDAALEHLANLRRKSKREAAEESRANAAKSTERLRSVQDLLRGTPARSTHRRRSTRNSFDASSRDESTDAVYSDDDNNSHNQTLRTMLSLPADAPSLSDDCALILIDVQQTYTTGPMELHNVQPAIRECATLLSRARRAGATIVHVQHHAGDGSLYDVNGVSGAIVQEVAPQTGGRRSRKSRGSQRFSTIASDDAAGGEKVITKSFPNSFHQTDLEEYLQRRGVRNLVICGFMAHCCVNSTARHAFNMGKFAKIAVVASATASRSLPDPERPGQQVSGESMKRAALAALSELHCAVVRSSRDVPE